MAKYGSDDCAFLLVGGYNVLGVTTQVEDTKEALTELTHALGDSWEEHTYTGIQRAAFTQEGFFDDASDSVNAALNENQGTAHVMSFGLQGNTIGQQFTGYSGSVQVNYVRVASRGELHKANATYQSSGIVEEGLIIHDLSAETDATGNTTASSVDGGAGNAPSADGGSGYLHVTSLTLGGYTNVVIKLRDSADDITYADLIEFTAATGVTAERKTVAGNVDRYVAASWAYTGAGTGQSVTFMAGFVRN